LAPRRASGSRAERWARATARGFRVARPASAAWNVAKTLGQIAVFWSFFLAVLPAGLVRLGSALGEPRFGFAGQAELASALFAAWSALGLWSGMTMALRGRGTPLPLDTARELVVTGPYRHMRNPMVLAGLGQGLAVGLGLGSPLVVAYSLAGGLLWQLLARPAEEADLLRRFGESYARYRQAVPCWRWRWRGWG
jgi:protein-S-isoprenylcysteine O-methyltransferase Ste14